MFGLGVDMSALIWLAFYSFSVCQSFPAFLNIGQWKNILNTISFYGLIKPLEGKKERLGEMER